MEQSYPNGTMLDQMTVAAVGTDNGLHTAPERAADAGDEGLVQSVPGRCDMSLQ